MSAKSDIYADPLRREMTGHHNLVYQRKSNLLLGCKDKILQNQIGFTHSFLFRGKPAFGHVRATAEKALWLGL